MLLPWQKAVTESNEARSTGATGDSHEDFCNVSSNVLQRTHARFSLNRNEQSIKVSQPLLVGVADTWSYQPRLENMTFDETRE